MPTIFDRLKARLLPSKTGVDEALEEAEAHAGAFALLSIKPQIMFSTLGAEKLKIDGAVPVAKVCSYILGYVKIVHHEFSANAPGIRDNVIVVSLIGGIFADITMNDAADLMNNAIRLLRAEDPICGDAFMLGMSDGENEFDGISQPQGLISILGVGRMS